MKAIGKEAQGLKTPIEGIEHMTKEERIASERARLEELLAGVDANELAAVQGLLDAASFMRISLQDLGEIVNENGYCEQYTNGKDQSGIKISSGLQTYLKMCTQYQRVINKLMSIVPPEPKRRPDRSRSVLAEVVPPDLEKEKARREKEAAFFVALRRGEVSQNDYRRFMAGEIDTATGE